MFATHLSRAPAGLDCLKYCNCMLHTSLTAAVLMQYFQSMIREGLNLHPTIGQPLARVVPPDEMEFDDLFFLADLGRIAFTIESHLPMEIYRSTDRSRHRSLGSRRNTDSLGPSADSFRMESKALHWNTGVLDC